MRYRVRENLYTLIKKNYGTGYTLPVTASELLYRLKTSIVISVFITLNSELDMLLVEDMVLTLFSR